MPKLGIDFIAAESELDEKDKPLNKSENQRAELNLPSDLLRIAKAYAIQRDTALNGRMEGKTGLLEAEQIDDYQRSELFLLIRDNFSLVEWSSS